MPLYSASEIEKRKVTQKERIEQLEEAHLALERRITALEKKVQ